MDRSRWIALLLLFYCGLGWGAPSSLRRSLPRRSPPAGLRFLGGDHCRFDTDRDLRRSRHLARHQSKHIWYYIIIGGLRIVSANVIWYTTVKYVPAGALAVVLGLTPIFTYGISLAMRLETFAAPRHGPEFRFCRRRDVRGTQSKPARSGDDSLDAVRTRRAADMRWPIS